jgi:hypothetical protein
MKRRIITATLLLLLSIKPLFAAVDKGIDVAEVQKLLAELCVDPGPIDGVWGRKTEIAIRNLWSANKNKYDGVFDKDDQNFLYNLSTSKSDCAISDSIIGMQSKARSIPWLFHDEFNFIAWKRYDLSHAPKKLAKLGHIQVSKEKNGNSFIILKSQVGQLSKFNRGQERYIKDRVELGTPDSQATFDLNDKILWYGFKVKSPTEKFIPNAHSVTFTQYKQIQKNAGRKKDCFPGMFWRMNAESNGTIWMAVTNEQGKKIGKTVIPSFINKNWSKVKVGVYFSESNDGWLKAFVNGRLVYSYNGRTVMNQFDKCTPKYFENRLRIGVYRGSDRKKLGNSSIPKNQSDTLHFDDFVVTYKRNAVDQALK